MRSSAIVLVAVVAVAGCGGATASTPPSAAPTSAPPTAAPLAVGEFTSHGVAATIDARGAGTDVTGSLSLSDAGATATVDLECSGTTASGVLIIGGLVTDSTFTDYFPAGHRVAVAFQPGPPIESVWYIAHPDEAILSCEAVVATLGGEADLDDVLEPIEGTVELGL